MKRVCKNCRFFGKEKSECRRYPPKYVTPAHSKWPVIFANDTDWCSEWREKEGEPQDYVNVEIRDIKTGLAAFSGHRTVINPKPGQLTIWNFWRVKNILSDIEIRIEWPRKEPVEPTNGQS